jgi:very-short-patch-repair endonuclease/DNA polymerase III delta prime subunit
MLDAKQILERLQASRKELLDLTYRNKLLNFTESRGKGARVIDENPAEILRILYDDQQRMSFAPVSDKDALSGETIDPENALERYIARKENHRPEDAHEKHLDSVLQTPYVQAVLESRLLNTFYDARSTIEEHGVNTLFLALGMLTYADPVDKSRILKAPAILLPVTLERLNARTDFILTHNGDEIGHNVSLQAKLKDGFGIDWPELPPEDDEKGFDLQAYLDRAEAAIASKPDWKLDRNEVQLAFFSFHKYVMHQDLDDRKWPETAPLVEQPVLRWLLGDEYLPADAPVIAPGTPLDDVLVPETLFHVVEADSSQAEALAEIGSGKNMIIQGPPGTGKSQTITNLIAQAVAQGKTVLFVAEKMAALEVVKRRLANIGLDDIAIELHSNKTNKRDFLNRLKSVWEKGAPVVPGIEQNLEELKGHIRDLNRHAGLVNQPIGQSGVTAYFLFGRLTQLHRLLSGKEGPRFEVEGWTAWTAAQYAAALELARKIEIVLSELGRLAEHPFRDSGLLTVLPMDLTAVESMAGAAAAHLRELAGVLPPLLQSLGLARAITGAELRQILDTVRQSESWPDLSAIPVDNPAWKSQYANIVELITQIEAIQRAKAPCQDELTEAAWSHGDAGALHAVLSSYQPVWYRWFCPAYRAAASKAAALWRIRPPFSLARRLAALQAVLEVQRRMKDVESNQESAAALFGSHWLRERSDAAKLREIADILHAFYQTDLERGLFTALAHALVEPGRRAVVRELAAPVESAASRYAGSLAGLVKHVKIGPQALDPGRGFDDYPLEAQAAFLKAWLENPRALLPMTRYNAIREEAGKAGLGPFQDACASWVHAAGHLAQLFEYRWSEALLKRHFQENPSLGQFSGGLADRRVETFREADTGSLRLNRGRILLQHHRQLPGLGAPGEMSVLSREFSKRARHLSIRTLLDRCGLAIQRAKPVFMMSPYSVASYLPKGLMQFDLVIFDEASQVRPVDALGAIARGRQVIVVGDSKQLPPTTFFEQMQEDEGAEEPANQTRDIESILKQFESKGAFSTLLRWHYRSRHHTLIGYSNKAFYEGKLVVFPSPAAGTQGQGLQFVHVPEGVYQRGETKRKNPVEAERVAREVLDHAVRNPGKSLGIVAFSIPQMREIQERVEVLRRENPEVEAFFGSHPDEPFFVKNLENVQGDERDVIFISVGYGKDESGQLLMNFGPLNKEGGERRLNVLISRAKERCLIFSNIRGDDLDLARSDSEGVRHLRGVLQFAEAGRAGLPGTEGGPEGVPFEDEVAEAVRAAGYTVRRRVGAGGFSIDLAVQDPGQPDRSILGIECDGESYHASRWARDRDRLRQQVLQGLGWRLHRVWSRAWFDDPAREAGRIAEAIRAALAEPVPVLATPAPVAPFERQRTPAAPDRLAPPPYEAARLGRIGQADDLSCVHGRLGDWILKVVRVESPVHAEVALRRIAEAADGARIGVRLRHRFEWSVKDLASRGELVRRDVFLWADARGEAVVRDRAQADALVKNIANIAPEEVALAFVEVVQRACSIEEEECFREVLGLLGLDILSQQRRAALGLVLADVVKAGRLERREGRLVVPS